MKTILYLFFILTNISNLLSQTWKENIREPGNFYSIRQAFLEYLDKKNKTDEISNAETDDEEKLFRRWEYFWEPRVYPLGKFPSPGILLEETDRLKQSNLLFETVLEGNWTPLEPSGGFPANGYSGRLNCIAFHPNDTNIIFVGSPSGGLWKSTDGGNLWIPLTDYLPSLGVSEIVIHPVNPDIMYIATGDRDAANFISNPYSYGLLKSTDGGYTWNPTGLSHIFADQMTIQRVIIHPLKPNILMAALTGTNGNLRGIWRTEDDGLTWKNVSGGGKFDIEFHPGNPDIVYCSGWKYLARSTNAGTDWTAISSSVLPVTDVTWAKIAVSEVNPDAVYAQYINNTNGFTYGMYKSWDKGLTWTKLNSFSISTQGSYDWVLCASPVDTNLILFGGQEFFYTPDGGATMASFQSGHVDHHAMVYRQGSNILYNCNDGGLYKSFNNGRNLINLNKSLQTFQYYRLGCSATNRNLILTGAQDNGTLKHSYGNRSQIGGGDGTECIVDYTDTSIYYYTYQYGMLIRKGTGLGTYTPPPNSGNSGYCAWVTPYLMHPTDPKTLYFGAKDIYRTTNRCNSWTNYSTSLTAGDGVGGGMLRAMAISESKPDSVLYAASYVVVYKTSDGGSSWHNITANLPTSAGCFDCSAISSIAVHPEKPEVAWVTMSGYSKNNKVFKTTDGGNSWLNISANLPAVPVNHIVFQKNSSEGLYIGTDIGVFYRDSTMNEWLYFMKGLPNVPVSELEIHYQSGKIRAATFGRGLWESDLYGTELTIKASDENTDKVWISPNPAKDYIEVKSFSNKSQYASFIIYNSLGSLVKNETGITSQTRDYRNPDYTIRRIEIGSLSAGIYYIRIFNKLYKFIKFNE